MHKGNVVLIAATLIAFVPQCFPQVLSPPEILDPAMRALQQKHLPELKAAAVDITAHHYPYQFYLSRKLDLTEQQEQLNDQRSIRFTNFQGRTVLQVTGNYFAAYSDESMKQTERVKQTYLDVMLPILRATASRLGGEPELNAFAIEVAHHVRKRVLGVTVEHAENLAVIVPVAAAEKVVANSSDKKEQVTALLESRVFIDGKLVSLWPDPAPEPTHAVAPPVVPAPAVTPPPAPAPAPVQDVSVAALQLKQTAYQGLIDRILHDLDGNAHFVSYAPPVLIGFRGKSYLQLSVTTNLARSDLGSQYRIAALAFDRHVSHLIRPLLAIVPKDSDFDGIVLSSTVRIPGPDAESSAVESVEFFMPLADMRHYEQYDITGQQLINAGFVLINGERVGLELQAAEATNK